MSDYAITFAPTLDRPPETMVGETVFDSGGNAIGWIVSAPAEPDEATMLQAKVKAQSDHIDKLRGEYKALDEQMERRCAEYCATIRKLKAELDAATVGVGTCHKKWRNGYGFCSECGCNITGEWANYCPTCGRKVVTE